jgi:hypothetical protein
MLIGLAIDFGIHFISRYKEQMRNRDTEAQAVGCWYTRSAPRTLSTEPVPTASDLGHPPTRSQTVFK